jgi:hypothetical protein
LQLGSAASLGGASSSSGGGAEGGPGSHRHHHDHHAEAHSSYRPLGEYKMEPDLEKWVPHVTPEMQEQQQSTVTLNGNGNGTPQSLYMIGCGWSHRCTLVVMCV